MKTLALVVVFFLSLAGESQADDKSKFVSVPGAPRPGETDYQWSLDTGETVPALSEELWAQITAPPKLLEVEGISHRLLVLPARGIKDPKYAKGAVILLQPGVTTTEFTALAMTDSEGKVREFYQEPSAVALHRLGFFYSVVVGPRLIGNTATLNPADRTLTHKTFASLELTHVREKTADITYADERATVKTRTTTLSFSLMGEKVEAAAQFYELTAQNQSVLQNEFEARNLSALVDQGKIDDLAYSKPYVERLMKIMEKNKASSPLLVETKAGVDAESIVHALAHELHRGTKLKGQADWQIYELNWTALNSQGLVNVTVDKIVKLFGVCKNKRVILYIPNIDQLKGLGIDQNTGSNDATASMQRDIAAGTVLVIGKTSNSGNNRLVSTSKAFLEGFTTVRVDSPTNEVLEPVLNDYMQSLEIAHSVRFEISPTRLIELTNQFIPEAEEAQPAKSISAVRALASQASTFMPADQKPAANGNIRITEPMLQNYLGEKSGIRTLGSNASAQGLKEFVRPKTYWPIMDRGITGHRAAKEAVLNALTLIADDTPIRKDAAGGELGISALLLLGSSGTGKSHVPKALSKALATFKVDMPVFPIELGKAKSEANVTTLTGASPGYLGFKEEGSKFLNQLRQHPQTILVLEEVDKADKSVMDAIYELLEEGRFQDANLNEVRFTRGLIVMTSNFGGQGTSKKTVVTDDGKEVTVQLDGTSDLIDEYDRWKILGIEPSNPEMKKWTDADLKRILKDQLITSGKISPQVFGRIGDSNVIIMHHFNREEIASLTRDWLVITADRFKDSTRGTPLEYTDTAKVWIEATAWGENGENAFNSGARAVIDILEKRIYTVAKITHSGLSDEDRTRTDLKILVDIENGAPVAKAVPREETK